MTKSETSKRTETFPSAQLRRLAARNGVRRMTKGFLTKLDAAVTKRAETLIRKADELKGERHMMGGVDVVRAYEEEVGA
jgi:hypothetical protein